MALTSLHRSKGSELFLYLLCFCSLSGLAVSESSIYEVLKAHGLPMGLLPNGVKNFTLDDSGNFQVHLEKACNAKFENEIHYDINVSGTLSYGLIGGLSGVSAQELFLWFPVKEIRVDVPSSGLIYFDVGVVSKQFSLSSFETPRDCVAVQFSIHDEDAQHLAETAVKNIYGELQYKLEQKDNGGRAVL